MSVTGPGCSSARVKRFERLKETYDKLEKTDPCHVRVDRARFGARRRTGLARLRQWHSGDNSSPAPTGITADNLKSLTLLQVKLDGAVDSSVIYLHGVNVKGASHDTYFMTTIYGKSIAVDAEDGAVLWEYTPEGYARWAGTPQFSTASPVADPDRASIYATTPGGDVVKLAVSDGHLLWSTSVTPAPASEKLPSPLILFRGQLIVVTGGYGGDRPPYVGHVAIVDAATGKILACLEHALQRPRRTDRSPNMRSAAICDLGTFRAGHRPRHRQYFCRHRQR